MLWPGSIPGQICFFYCSRCPGRAVLLAGSTFSTAPDAPAEQYSWPILLSLLLLIPERSSTNDQFHFLYCSRCPGRAVLLAKSAFSTAPVARAEQYSWPIPLSLLLPLPVPRHITQKYKKRTATFVKTRQFFHLPWCPREDSNLRHPL